MSGAVVRLIGGRKWVRCLSSMNGPPLSSAELFLPGRKQVGKVVRASRLSSGITVRTRPTAATSSASSLSSPSWLSLSLKTSPSSTSTKGNPPSSRVPLLFQGSAAPPPPTPPPLSSFTMTSAVITNTPTSNSTNSSNNGMILATTTAVPPMWSEGVDLSPLSSSAYSSFTTTISVEEEEKTEQEVQRNVQRQRQQEQQDGVRRGKGCPHQSVEEKAPTSTSSLSAHCTSSSSWPLIRKEEDGDRLCEDSSHLTPPSPPPPSPPPSFTAGSAPLASSHSLSWGPFFVERSQSWCASDLALTLEALENSLFVGPSEGPQQGEEVKVLMLAKEVEEGSDDRPASVPRSSSSCFSSCLPSEGFKVDKDREEEKARKEENENDRGRRRSTATTTLADAAAAAQPQIGTIPPASRGGAGRKDKDQLEGKEEENGAREEITEGRVGGGDARGGECRGGSCFSTNPAWGTVVSGEREDVFLSEASEEGGGSISAKRATPTASAAGVRGAQQDEEGKQSSSHQMLLGKMYGNRPGRRPPLASKGVECQRVGNTIHRELLRRQEEERKIFHFLQQAEQRKVAQAGCREGSHHSHTSMEVIYFSYFKMFLALEDPSQSLPCALPSLKLAGTLLTSISPSGALLCSGTANSSRDDEKKHEIHPSHEQHHSHLHLHEDYKESDAAAGTYAAPDVVPMKQMSNAVERSTTLSGMKREGFKQGQHWCIALDFLSDSPSFTTTTASDTRSSASSSARQGKASNRSTHRWSESVVQEELSELQFILSRLECFQSKKKKMLLMKMEEAEEKPTARRRWGKWWTRSNSMKRMHSPLHVPVSFSSHASREDVSASPSSTECCVMNVCLPWTLMNLLFSDVPSSTPPFFLSPFTLPSSCGEGVVEGMMGVRVPFSSISALFLRPPRLPPPPPATPSLSLTSKISLLRHSFLSFFFSSWFSLFSSCSSSSRKLRNNIFPTTVRNNNSNVNTNIIITSPHDRPLFTPHIGFQPSTIPSLPSSSSALQSTLSREAILKEKEKALHTMMNECLHLSFFFCASAHEKEALPSGHQVRK